jgi:hypothetical protein
LDFKREIVAGASYPTDGLIDRWDFEDTLEGLNGHTWISGDSLTYDYVSGKAGGKGVRKTSASIQAGRLYIAENNIGYDNFDASTSSWSWSLFFQMPGSSTQNTGLLGKGSYHTQPAAKFAQITSYSNPDWTRIDSGNFGADNRATGLSFAAANWHHYVITCDRTGLTSGTIKMYLNNTLIGTFTSNFPSANTTDFQLFRLWQNECATQYCIVDLLYLYNRVLTTDEISQLYNSGNGV